MARARPVKAGRDGFVAVRGARQHNLRNVDVDIPRDSLVAFTGISGSGKSSLAFGTIYAEAQRRYFESIAPYARRLLQQVESPQVDDITGLPPAVALQQRRGTASSRSTVGTITTLSNLVRMLYSRAGTYPPDATDSLDSEAFSPNTAAGACPTCHGLGTAQEVTEDLLVPDPSLSITEGAIAGWPGGWQGRNLRDVVRALGYDVDVPWRKLSRRARDFILFSEEQPVVLVEPEEDRNEGPYNGRFWSARSSILNTLVNSKSESMRERVMRFVERVPCPSCDGTGLRPEALAVTFAGLDIAQLGRLPLTRVADVLRPTAQLTQTSAASRLPESGERSEAARMIASGIVERLDTLCELGLGYLSLSRPSPTLSSGEAQRLRLATQLRSGLFGVVYVLDEPSAGLHPADAEPLVAVLQDLKKSGNSVFVVEHDMDVVRRADWVVDVGPGAGEAGGHVLYSGPVAGLERIRGSATARALFTADRSTRAARREPTGQLHLRHVTRHNLVDLEACFPLGVFTAVTGVSGSGKSTLVTQVLASVVSRHLGITEETLDEDPDLDLELPSASASEVVAQGLDAFDRLVRVDQRPIGRTPRSNLATYTGLFDHVRRLFASTDEARRRGYSAGRFSFNVAEGRCPTCQGEGFVAVELLFLPGTHARCPTCNGARYDADTLEVTWREVTIAGVLGLTVDAAAELFADVAPVLRSLSTLQEVGLGYLRLGQPATELSGGEAQRIKLATELQRGRRGHSLYILDEPTTGLHPADVELLMRQLHRLVDAGNTVIVVEHDMNVVADADWVIDLGPGGGDAGGRIVAAGPPRAVAAAANSATAPYLRRALRRR